MSWDGYIDNLVAQGKGSVDRVCIIGLDGGAAWTTSGHEKAFKLNQAEAINIARSLKTKDFSGFQSGGIHAEGVKYQFLREEDGKIVVGKKKELGSLVFQSTKTAIVCAHCSEGGQAGDTKKAVAIIAEYLESVNM